MADHPLKTWPAPFAAVEAGLKSYEVRKADRPYAVGDTLTLREWEPAKRDGYVDKYIPVPGGIGEWHRLCTEAAEFAYTGRVLRRRVIHILQGGQFGIERGYVVLSIAPMESEVEP